MWENEDNKSEERGNLPPFLVLALVMAVFLVAALALLIYQFNIIEEDRKAYAETAGTAAVLRENLLAANQSLADMTEEKENLRKENEAVSAALNSKSEELDGIKAEAARTFVPTLYPVKGGSMIEQDAEAEDPAEEEDGEELPDHGAGEVAVADDYQEDDAETEDDGEKGPGVYIRLSEGAYVIAAATGNVTGVDYDEKGRTVITIDHENGYISIYSGNAKALVSEGDRVYGGAAVMVFFEEGARFNYRIQYEGNEADPMSVMEING